ncbi:hypothetical protein HPP92_011245 [Vanilla planifolia]|uniref:Uncharacterized protein n=1 Tax=Vanilla planifolia TaxID=51239 RepID=A0A835V4U6_VANPL|nr:hypothetical protein HPP92_011245 [Vanilla planifolia]
MADAERRGREATARSAPKMGMCSLTLTTSLSWLRPEACISSNAEDCRSKTKGFQTAIFYCSLYIIGIGAGGRRANTTTLGAIQFDNFEPKERSQKFSFFNWWSFAQFIGGLFSCTVLVYIQENVSWSLGYTIATIGSVLSLLSFASGTPVYRHRLPGGSPFTRLAMVFVAAARKWRVTLPVHPWELHELDAVQYAKEGKHRINHTASVRFDLSTQALKEDYFLNPFDSCLRVLDKAAVKSGSDGPWMLCPVTLVEEAKKTLRLLPVFVSTLMPSVMLAQVMTLFIKQGATLDCRMGPHFSLPPASLSAFLTATILLGLVVYDRLFVPFLRERTGNPRGITLLRRIGVGQVMQIVISVIAALTERWRLRVAESHGLTDENATVPLTVFVLLPQFILLGITEVFVGVGKMELFFDQAPEGMKSLGSSLFTLSLGIGGFLSSFLLSTVTKVTGRGGRKPWVQNNLNVSHLDYYYGLLAVLNAVNFVFFLFVAMNYMYSGETFQTESEAMEAGEKEMALEES